MSVSTRGVLFDKDGTLIDFDSMWVPLYRAALMSLTEGDAVHVEDMLVRSGYDAETGRCKPGTTLTVGTTDAMVSEWRPDLAGAALEAAIIRIDDMFADALGNVTPVTNLDVLFGTLRGNGYRLGVATNDVTRSAQACFDHLNLTPQLDFITGYDGVETPKPAPDMAHAFCEACGLEPSHVVVVGDNIHDLEMGVAAGVGLTVGVLSGNAAEEDFGTAADAVVGSVADLPALLDEKFPT